MSTRYSCGLILTFSVALIVGCSGTSGEGGRKAQATPRVNDLYNQIGEQKLRAVVNDTVDRSAKDPKVALDRAGQAAGWSATPQNVQDFKRSLFQFVAAATGGPQEYQGQDMATAHKGMNVTNEQFDAMMSHLQAAMEKNGIPPDAQHDLRQVFEGTRSAIVQQRR